MSVFYTYTRTGPILLFIILDFLIDIYWDAPRLHDKDYYMSRLGDPNL